MSKKIKEKQKRAKIKPRKTKSKKILIGIVIGILIAMLCGGVYYTQLVIIKPQITIESGSVWDKKGSIFIEKQGNLEIKNISYKNKSENVEHKNELLVETVYYKDDKEVSKDEAVNKETNKLNKGFTSKMVVVGAYKYDVEIKSRDGRIFRTSLEIQDTQSPELILQDKEIEEGQEVPSAKDFFKELKDASRVNEYKDIYFVKKEEIESKDIKDGDILVKDDKVEVYKAKKEATKETKKASKTDSKKTTKKTSKQKKMSASKQKSFVAILTNKVGMTEVKAVEKTTEKKEAKTKSQKATDKKAKDKKQEEVKGTKITVYRKLEKLEDTGIGEHQITIIAFDMSNNPSKPVTAKLKITEKPVEEVAPEETQGSTGGSYSGGSNSGYRRNSGGGYRGNSGGNSGGSAPAGCGSQGYSTAMYGTKGPNEAYVWFGCGGSGSVSQYHSQYISQFQPASLAMIRECNARYGESCVNNYGLNEIYDNATGKIVGLVSVVDVYDPSWNKVASGYFKSSGQMQWINKGF